MHRGGLPGASPSNTAKEDTPSRIVSDRRVAGAAWATSDGVNKLLIASMAPTAAPVESCATPARLCRIDAATVPRFCRLRDMEERAISFAAASALWDSDSVWTAPAAIPSASHEGQGEGEGGGHAGSPVSGPPGASPAPPSSPQDRSCSRPRCCSSTPRPSRPPQKPPRSSRAVWRRPESPPPCAMVG